MQEYRPFFFDIYSLFYICTLFYHFPVNNAKFFLIFCIISTLVRKMTQPLKTKAFGLSIPPWGKNRAFFPTAIFCHVRGAQDKKFSYQGI